MSWIFAYVFVVFCRNVAMLNKLMMMMMMISNIWWHISSQISLMTSHIVYGSV